MRYLTDVEESKLRSVIQERWPEHIAEFDVALNVGLRASEQYNLRWLPSIAYGYVDLQQQVISIPKSKHRGPRHIRLNQSAREALQSLHAKGERVFENFSPRHWFKPDPKTHPPGAVHVAGIKNFTWHDLRHTFASRLVMAGVNLQKVQELMGHRSIVTTQRYAHLAPDYQEDAVDRLDIRSGGATRTAIIGKKKP